MMNNNSQYLEKFEISVIPNEDYALGIKLGE